MRSGTSGRNLAFSGDGRWTHRSSLECAGSADFPRPASAFRCSKAAEAAKEGKKRGFLSCFNPTSPVASLAQGSLMPIHQIGVSYLYMQVGNWRVAAMDALVLTTLAMSILN